MMEFHISRNARTKYKFDELIFALNGNVIFANFHAARVFAQKMNQKRDLVHFPELTIKAGQINALGMIDEILHLVFKSYREKINPQILENSLSHLENVFGVEIVNRLLTEFCIEFPPRDVYAGNLPLEIYMEGGSEGSSNRTNTLEELILLWVTNRNPAAIKNFQELFDEKQLLGTTKYGLILKELYTFFDTQPYFGPDNQNIIDMLRAPALASPNSLTGQLEFIRSKWGEIIGKYLYRLLSSLDLIKEEDKLVFINTGHGETQIPTYSYDSIDRDYERYSTDKEWMPRLVLLAKNTLVWLDQLSKKYQTSITRLDQIPDQELDLLSHRGFTGLWLIGLWERSDASARIKQMCGNPDAVSSAYSLSRYEIANEIGGNEAYANLRNRAWQRGIRLASDMVPNHMGIDSDWVLQNPDRFLSLPYSPFPSYTFDGPNLSPIPEIEIKIEDHYYNRTDAAVVFRRVDYSNGDTRYIYHGNDGTSMPWNDTAQINYLNPEAREAIIQTILNVARKFPIIRFDAAMTLARKHVQRLWFPEPGSGGDIPSRSEHGLTREAFQTAMPHEFWREVVDRVALEAPDTLLLAEAFWLMESYFVRTLGMHRVYNSAFMHMLRNEENSKFRQLIKNTLEYDPEILRRYVNFISNPDERTAIDQFGKGDKYFGTCTLMATLPGLPMFGHGQIEGYTEKYGMEYKKAYYDEQPDEDLVHRHEREIFPLNKKRALFAGVENFNLFDFFTNSGQVDENVILYTNGVGHERILVAYHNHFSETSGWIRTSCAFSKRSPDGSRYLSQTSLVDALNLTIRPNCFVLFRDQNKGLEYIRRGELVREQGLFLHLKAFSCWVFQDFRIVDDDEAHLYSRLCDMINGGGVPSISEAIQEIFLEPVLLPLQEILNPGYFKYLDEQIIKKALIKPEIIQEAREKTLALLKGLATIRPPMAPENIVLDETTRMLNLLFDTAITPDNKKIPGYSTKKQVALLIQEDASMRFALFAYVFLARIGKQVDPHEFQASAISLIDEWNTARIITALVLESGFSANDALRVITLVRVLINLQDWTNSLEKLKPESIFQELLRNPDIQFLLQINRYKDILWYSKEGFSDLVNCMIITLQINPEEVDQTIRFEKFLQANEFLSNLQKAHESSEYQVEKLIQSLEETSDQAA